MAQLTRLVAPLLALLLAGSVASAADTPKVLVGRVVSIVDGDTIKVHISDRTETVRYIGMNAPELHHPAKGAEPGGREATEANRKLVEGEADIRSLDTPASAGRNETRGHGRRDAAGGPEVRSPASEAALRVPVRRGASLGCGCS